MRLKQKARLAIGVVCVLVSVVLALTLTLSISAAEEMVSVVVLMKNVDLGELIPEDALELVSLPKKYVESLEGVFDSVEVCLESQPRAGAYLVKGQVVTGELLMGKQDPMTDFVTSDMRLASVSTGTVAEAISGQIRAGDVVSVAALDPETGEYAMNDRLRYLQVYSLADDEGNIVDSMGTLSEQGESPEESGPTKILTFICDEEQALLLAEMQQRNLSVFFVGRGPIAESFLERDIP